MRHQQRIDELLEEREEQSDHSLRKKALDRAMCETVPRTLTPWEWQEWYAEHGVPEAHSNSKTNSDEHEAPAKPWWRRWL
jgi:hypothetical protein